MEFFVKKRKTNFEWEMQMQVSDTNSGVVTNISFMMQKYEISIPVFQFPFHIALSMIFNCREQIFLFRLHI